MTLTKTQAIGAFISTVVLGALGSGLWERVFAPMTNWTTNYALTLVTLGIKSTNDSIYVRVAQGHSESAAIGVFGFLLMFFFLLPVCLGQAVYLMNRSVERTEERSKLDLSKMSEDELISLMEKTQARLGAATRRLKFSSKIVYIICLAILFEAVFLQAKWLTVSYANKAIVNFDQSLTIIAPYINDTDIKLFRSEFARIHNKSDYVILLDKMKKVANSKSLRFPEFDPW